MFRLRFFYGRRQVVCAESWKGGGSYQRGCVACNQSAKSIRSVRTVSGRHKSYRVCRIISVRLRFTARYKNNGCSEKHPEEPGIFCSFIFIEEIRPGSKVNRKNYRRLCVDPSDAPPPPLMLCTPHLDPCFCDGFKGIE